MVLITWFVAAVAGAEESPRPEKVEQRAVTIFSDGVRMAGDLYWPTGLKAGDKRPAVVCCNGTGGTKRGAAARFAVQLAGEGFIVLAFDYRGWGESDSKLVTLEKQPKPDAQGEMRVKVRAVRWQMDFADQAMDIRAALAFVGGEPAVDRERLGLWGSSYGGGLVTGTAGNDPRVKCVVAQVPGVGGMRAAPAVARAYEQLAQQARGEIEPVPFETGKLTGQLERYAQMRANPPKNIGYSPVEAAEKITRPVLFVVAEKDELVSNAAVQRVQQSLVRRGVPSDFHVVAGITHYGVYREGFEEATKVEVAWFNQYLKPVAAPKP